MNKKLFSAFIILFVGVITLCAQTQKNFIIQIEGDRIYLDMYAPDVKTGDLVAVYADGGYIIHPVTKAKIKKEPERVGSITLENVYDSYSIGKADSDLKIALKTGMEVRKESSKSELVATAPVKTAAPLATPAKTSADGKIAVVVTPAEVNDVVGIGHFGGYVADILMEHLLLNSKITLVDRSVLNAQIDEANLTGKYIDPKTAVKQGKIIGAKYIVQVTMQKPDVVNTKTGVPLASIMGAAQSISGVNLGAQYASNLGTATLRAAVSITTRVIDMETGEVVFMCSGNGTAKGKTQLAAEYGALGGTLINGGVGGFKQTVTGQAIEKAFATIGNSLNDYFDGQVTQRVISHSATNQDTQLFARGTTLYMGSHKLQSEEVSDVFVNAPQLYFDYKKGKSMATWSVPLMIVGGLTTLMCGISYIVNSSIDYQQGEGSQSELLAGTIVGVAALGGGIYLRSLGTNKINIAVDEYNTYHSISYNKALQPHLYLIAGGGGLGLRLTF